MQRYSVIKDKHPREIVLLKAFPCAWGKCTFCDYIDDNSNNQDEMNELNQSVLAQVTGATGVLEVIDSASCFELPRETLIMIKDIIKEKNIRRLFLESHWIYRHRLDEMREFMGVPVTFKIGVETFDNDFRQNVLNKNAGFEHPEEVARYFDSPCIMVGIKGQTKAMIDYDIEMLTKYFDLGTINIYSNNTTNIKRDDTLVSWFSDKYRELHNHPSIEVLSEITDFGVG